jgi:uncharacterized protein with PIN domain
MKFIADSMLGRLARLLRLLGYDTLYYPHIEDGLLLRFAREQNRILLTRNTRLVKVRGLRHFLLLKENDTYRQLKRVVASFNLKSHDLPDDSQRMHKLSRCAVCNGDLERVSKEAVKSLIPEYVYLTSHVFKRCSGCGKTYWDGTHPGKFRKKLSGVLQEH